MINVFFIICYYIDMENFFETLSEMFYRNSKPLIICDSDGTNCIFNKQAERVFGYSVTAQISDISDSLVLSEEHPEQIITIRQNDYYIHLSYNKNSSQWILELRNSFNTEWDDFVRCQKKLHVLFLDLLVVTNESDLFRKLITKARKLLDIDRIEILLFDEKSKSIIGSWGTNSRGEVVDQSSYISSLENFESLQETLHYKDLVLVSEDRDLYFEGEVIGRGWNATSSFYAGYSPVGWISCDNLLSNKPLPVWKKEILGELSRMTGEFVFNLRLENHLKREVEKKTLILNKTITRLKETQDNLIESEKMASLGSLISGVAHEINTPVGVALTSISHLKEVSEGVNEKFLGNMLKKKDLSEFLNDTLYGSELALKSIKKAGDLVNIFKQLSVDQNSSIKENNHLKSLIDTVLISVKYNLDLDRVNILLDIDEDIMINCNTGSFYPIFSNLIENSVIHGFTDEQNRTIRISAKELDSEIEITYDDNGLGIADKLDKRVFDPFYTTKRAEGRTGLGLTIVYNNIKNIGGDIRIDHTSERGLRFIIRLNKE